jgi:hypothetical protein
VGGPSPQRLRARLGSGLERTRPAAHRPVQTAQVRSCLASSLHAEPRSRSFRPRCSPSPSLPADSGVQNAHSALFFTAAEQADPPWWTSATFTSCPNTLSWERRSEDFTYETYNRRHLWRFDAGLEFPAAASPEYRGDADCVDPEEALVAALSSCHMLTFVGRVDRPRCSRICRRCSGPRWWRAGAWFRRSAGSGGRRRRMRGACASVRCERRRTVRCACRGRRCASDETFGMASLGATPLRCHVEWVAHLG